MVGDGELSLGFERPPSEESPVIGQRKKKKMWHRGELILFPQQEASTKIFMCHNTGHASYLQQNAEAERDPNTIVQKLVCPFQNFKNKNCAGAEGEEIVI